jgi:hypothetical protein
MIQMKAVDLTLSCVLYYAYIQVFLYDVSVL